MCLSHTHHAIGGRLDPAPARPSLTRRRLLLGGALAATATLAPGRVLAAGPPPGRGAGPRMADLTWTLSPAFPVFADGEEAVRETSVTIENDGYYLQRWEVYEHTATHVDAPGHFAAGGRLGPDLRPDELVVPAVVIDIRGRAAADPDAEVTVDDLIAFERRRGRIPRRAAVLMWSGWEALAASTDAYRGTDADGRYHFPGFGVEAVDWLMAHRDITAIGVDTLSLDHGPSQTFAVHGLLLGADRYGIENLRNLGAIPPRGAELFVGLVPLEEGSGGPCRVLARW
jgi:kynurenine formamidase